MAVMLTDAEKAKNVLLSTTKALRAMERELLAHVLVINIIKMNFGLDDAIDHLLEAGRNLPSIEQKLREKYDVQLEGHLTEIDEADLEKQLQHIFERSKPEGQTKTSNKLGFFICHLQNQRDPSHT